MSEYEYLSHRKKFYPLPSNSRVDAFEPPPPFAKITMSAAPSCENAQPYFEFKRTLIPHFL